ncbi:MAG: HD-GYP domain-containing protein [Nitrospira sp.]|nr:HD-GYP domain-containing protein [Nitrospira sp.]
MSSNKKNSYLQWQPIINFLPYPAVLIDYDFNIVMMNDSMKEISVSKEDLTGSNCQSLLPKPECSKGSCPMIAAYKSHTKEQSVRLDPDKSQTTLYIAQPLLENGNVTGGICSCIDISDSISSSELIHIYADAVHDLKNKEMRSAQAKEAFFNMLEDLNESYGELEELFLKLISVVINALDAKSTWTRGHSDRVAMYAESIAIELKMDEDEIKDIRLAGLLHDIGKIGTYDDLLDKPDGLTKEEFEIVMEHPAQGAKILKDIKQLSEIIPLIRAHHEKLDGTGYPDGIKDSKIPMGAKILHVADSFDSMTSDRPYRAAPGLNYALTELERYKGTQFDGKVVEGFLRVLSKSNYMGLNLCTK